ncbi:hypothetical protein [Clostridium botulinum]|uniref:hypothetical protein n=1 Tax=Clostridium botulinum TaxID=1491 RepID=UPI0007731D47|nr:hypothetical protein [Clostridium botulinum]MBN3352106.1 hypothetical protein [Clostridium botulinum]MBN3402887.1 hypothetical protein [Clostridium botulinum]MBN3447604.1 hypothetical protein [Clostridium botulinum]
MKYYLTVKNMKNFLNQFEDKDLIGFCNLDGKNVSEFCMKPSMIFPIKVNLQEYEKLINSNGEEIKDNNLTVVDFTFKNSEDTLNDIGIHKICEIGKEVLINDMVNKLHEMGIEDVDEYLGLS